MQTSPLQLEDVLLEVIKFLDIYDYTLFSLISKTYYSALNKYCEVQLQTKHQTNTLPLNCFNSSEALYKTLEILKSNIFTFQFEVYKYVCKVIHVDTSTLTCQVVGKKINRYKVKCGKYYCYVYGPKTLVNLNLRLFSPTSFYVDLHHCSNFSCKVFGTMDYERMKLHVPYSLQCNRERAQVYRWIAPEYTEDRNEDNDVIDVHFTKHQLQDADRYW